MKVIDKSLTPYAFFRMPFEDQLKNAHMNLLNNWEFFRHPMPERRKLLIAADPSYAELEEKLLALSGTSMVYAAEPHLAEIIGRGIAFSGKSKTIRGISSHCHGNASTLWEEYRGAFEIITGWALTKDDGMWRQHTWGRMDGILTIETTMKRSKYFGFVLNDLEAKDFAEQNPY